MLKLKIKIGDLAEAECEGASQQELFQQAAFWHSLPTVCPVDGSAVRFGYREGEDKPFYSLLSSGEKVYEFPIGQGTGDRGMFAGKMLGEGKQKKFVQRWLYYDHDAQKQVVVWENGRMLIDAAPKPSPMPVPSPRNAKPIETVHRNIASEAELNAMLDEVLPLSESFDDIPGAVTDAQKIEALGVALYGSKATWGTKVKGLCQFFSGKRAMLPSELTFDEVVLMRERLEVKVREAYDATAQALFNAQVPQPDVDPDSLNGLALAQAYTVLCKIQAKQVA